jgi:hypothetical protein
VKDEHTLAVYAIEDATRRFDDLPIARTAGKLARAAAAVRMRGELLDVGDDPLHQG